MTRTRGSRSKFLIVFVTIWMGIVGVFDVIAVTQLYRQFDAGRRFVPVAAVVEESRVESDSSGDGTTYTAHVLYRYEVDGRVHRSDRVSFAEWGTSSHERAQRLVEEYPVGQGVTALVDPDDPLRAVLRADLERFPFAILLFLTPFHCVPAGLWVGIRGARRRATAKGMLAAMVAADDGSRAVLRSLTMAPALVFVIALGVGSFFATFAVVFTTGFDGPPGIVLQVLGGLVLVAGSIAFWFRRRGRTPDRFTVFDDSKRSLYAGGFPPGAESAMLDRGVGEEVRYDDVREVAIESRGVADVNGRPWQRHEVLLRRAAGDAVVVARLSGYEGAAGPVADWVRRRVGVSQEGEVSQE